MWDKALGENEGDGGGEEEKGERDPRRKCGAVEREGGRKGWWKGRKMVVVVLAVVGLWFVGEDKGAIAVQDTAEKEK